MMSKYVFINPITNTGIEVNEILFDACTCKSDHLGVFDKTVELELPQRMIDWYDKRGIKKKTVCVDECLAEEIKALWQWGIITTGCCCGHGARLPYIGVIEEHIPLMKKFKYVVHTNFSSLPDSLKRKDSFYPKSIKITPKMVEKSYEYILEIVEKYLEKGDKNE